MGCGSEDYLTQLEGLDQTDLAALNDWLDENEAGLREEIEIDEIDHRTVDTSDQFLPARRLEHLEMEFFVSWSFEIVSDEEYGEVLLFTYIWDYEAYILPLIPQMEADVIGRWDEGSGRHLSGDIGTADRIEILADGTATIFRYTNRGGLSETRVTWEIDTRGYLLMGSGTYIFERRGDTLVLSTPREPSSERLFQFVPEGQDWAPLGSGGSSSGSSSSSSSSSPSGGSGSGSSSSSGNAALEASLAGQWNWLGSWYYTFNADGTGERLGLSGNDSFTWTISGDELRIVIHGMTERWNVDITGNTMILSSAVLEGLEFTYTRR